MTLREDQIRRYSRHILLPDVGGTGQARLLAATVPIDLAADRPAAIVAATYLAAAGVGTLILSGADPALFDALTARLTDLNPDVTVVTGTSTGTTTPDLFPDVGLAPVVGSEVADALVRGGLVACRIVQQIATGR